MADHREVRYELLYVRVPSGTKLRRTAAGRLKRLVSDGWRETDRTQMPDFLRVRLERSGHPPLMKHLPAIPVQQGRPQGSALQLVALELPECASVKDPAVGARIDFGRRSRLCGNEAWRAVRKAEGRRRKGPSA